MRAIDTAEKARREAVSRLIEQRACNREYGQDAMFEYAYSPSTFAVGIRPADWADFVPTRERFRVFNVNYPRYRDDGSVHDWVSVGTDDPRMRSDDRKAKARA